MNILAAGDIKMRPLQMRWLIKTAETADLMMLTGNLINTAADVQECKHWLQSLAALAMPLLA
ncbi:hypothetical protein BH09VER1_BH09VER1_47550 [soil metagenome]